jgi:hypothetical protein
MKWIFLAAGLIFGAFSSYLIFKKKTPELSFANTIDVKNKVSPYTDASPIPYVLAQDIIKQFIKDSSKFKIKTLRDRALKGFWIDSGAVKKMLAQDPTCNGIRIYFANSPLNHDPNRKVISLVFLATKSDPANRNKAVDVFEPNSLIYDFVDPCPDNCGTIAQ